MVVVGSVNIDTSFSVDRLPLAGETLVSDRVIETVGGKGANQAVAAARAGATVALIAAVGDDHQGRQALTYLGGMGVDVSGCKRVQGVPTGLAHILVERGGANQIVVATLANGELHPSDVSAAASLISAARLLVTQQEIPWPSLAEALRIARAEGTTSLLNASPARPGRRNGPPPSITVVNRPEAEALTGLSNAPATELAASLSELTASTAVVTDGRNGAAAGDGTRTWQVPALEVEVVDSSGAGDVFVGALAAALSRGAGLERALIEASAAGSLAVSMPGAGDCAPARDEIMRAIEATTRSVPGRVNPR